MAASLDLHKLKSPRLLGEALRDAVFTAGKGYGCLSNFELEPAFTPVDPESDKGRKLIALLVSDPDNSEEIREYIEGTVSFSGGLWSDGTIDVAWHWDSDGTLLFHFDGTAVINTDCKNDHDWTYLAPAGFIPCHRHFEPSSVDYGHFTIHPVFGRHNQVILAASTLLLAKKFDFHGQFHAIYQDLLTDAAHGAPNAERIVSQAAASLAKTIRYCLQRYPRAGDRKYFTHALAALGDLAPAETTA